MDTLILECDFHIKLPDLHVEREEMESTVREEIDLPEFSVLSVDSIN